MEEFVSDLQLFEFAATGQHIRTVLIDEQPWFVAADLAAVLGYRDAHNASRLLREAERTTHLMSTPSGQQECTIVSESGFYRLVMRSNRPEADQFQTWVTSEVLPALRRTGRYAIPGAPVFELPQTMSEALRLAADQFDRAEAERAARLVAEQRAAALEPAAAAWDHLGSGGGDWSVGDAAKILSRDPAIRTGRGRLFTVLAGWGWIYRARGDQHWRPYQAAVDAGRLMEAPQSHFHPRTGDLVLDPPQVRITPKGLAEAHRRLGGTAPLAVAEQLALGV
jgi:prophage antirepressor-like protein